MKIFNLDTPLPTEGNWQSAVSIYVGRLVILLSVAIIAILPIIGLAAFAYFDFQAPILEGETLRDSPESLSAEYSLLFSCIALVPIVITIILSRADAKRRLEVFKSIEEQFEKHLGIMQGAFNDKSEFYVSNPFNGKKYALRFGLIIPGLSFGLGGSIWVLGVVLIVRAFFNIVPGGAGSEFEALNALLFFGVHIFIGLILLTVGKYFYNAMFLRLISANEHTMIAQRKASMYRTRFWVPFSVGMNMGLIIILSVLKDLHLAF